MSNVETIVNGYVRQNWDGIYPVEIVKLIYEFYLLTMDSNILDKTEQISLLDLLWDRLRQQPENKNMKDMDTKLLFRASENEFEATSFHKLCDNKGATITIIHSKDNDYIFGGYTSKSWKLGGGTVSDLNAFLFKIRPNVAIFELKDRFGNGAIWNYTGYGPIFGTGHDVYIINNSVGCWKRNQNTYDYTLIELCGEKGNSFGNVTMTVQDYEVFSVDICTK